MSFDYEVEVLQLSQSFYSNDVIAIFAERFLLELGSIVPGKYYYIKDHANIDDHQLRKNIKAILINDLKCQTPPVKINDGNVLKFFVYKMEIFSGSLQFDLHDRTEEENRDAGNHWSLPSMDFLGLWESLIYDSSIKKEILKFSETALLYADNCVDSNLVSLNKVILFHGPPGTGKTSLCKALAQKLSIRLGERFTSAKLVEINSHSLFSKWFSESSKRVMKMFEELHKLASNPEMLVCVLLDEVESLTHSRVASFDESDQSESIRVVNTILTQLDSIKKYPNVFIMAASNITGAIDSAFVDRADIKQYIGLPTLPAIYQIYTTSIYELAAKNIIILKEEILSYQTLEANQFVEQEGSQLSLDLLSLSEKSAGLSGRTLRKMPMIAHSLYVDVCPVDAKEFMQAMVKAVERQKRDDEIFLK